MDTGYPALIPELLDNHHVIKPSTVPPPTNPANPRGTVTQVDLKGTPPIKEKIS